MPCHRARSQDRGSSHHVRRRVEPHRGPAVQVVSRPARVAGLGEGDPGAVHGAGERPAAGRRRAGDRTGARQGWRCRRRTAPPGRGPRRAPGRPRRTRTCTCRQRRRRGMGVGEANGGDPHPPVGLHRREQVAGAGVRVPRPVGGQRRAAGPARRRPGTGSRRRATGPVRISSVIWPMAPLTTSHSRQSSTFVPTMTSTCATRSGGDPLDRCARAGRRRR